jgi:hypothetical protein
MFRIMCSLFAVATATVEYALHFVAQQRNRFRERKRDRWIRVMRILFDAHSPVRHRHGASVILSVRVIERRPSLLLTRSAA